MNISFMKDATCDLCEEAIEDGFELHEIEDGGWHVICVPCTLVTELNEGK